MPFIDGSTTARTAAAVTAASIALPPFCSTRRPAAEASDWLVAIMPWRPTAGERVPAMLPDGRSPGICAVSVVMVTRMARVVMTAMTGRRMGPPGPGDFTGI